MTAVETILFSTLANDTAVAALAASRISPITRPQSDELPAVTYQLIDSMRHHNCGGATGWVAHRWQVNCWAATPDAAQTLAAAVIAALDNVHGAGVDHCAVIDAADLPALRPENAAQTAFGRRLDCMMYVNE